MGLCVAFFVFGGAAAIGSAVAGCVQAEKLLSSTSMFNIDSSSGDNKNIAPLKFREIAKSNDTTYKISQGYNVERLISWGDSIMDYAGGFNPSKLTAESQRLRFGYNNDFIAYLPFVINSDDSNHGLLFVNHEYSVGRLMFSGIEAGKEVEQTTKEQIEVEQQALGCSVIEVVRNPMTMIWQVKIDSVFSRRVTATTPIIISGAAAGHDRFENYE